MIRHRMVPLPHLTVPSWIAVVAWGLVLLAPLTARLPVAPAARLLLLPGIAVALGTAEVAWMGWRVEVGSLGTTAELAAVFVAASGTWVHATLAAAAAALVGAIVWAWRSGPVSDAFHMPWTVAAALAALLTAQFLGLRLGGAHGWLLVPMAFAHVGIAVIGVGMARRRLRTHTLGWTVAASIGLACLSASVGLQAEAYRPLIYGGIDPRDATALEAAARTLRVTGPGLLAAAGAVSWAARHPAPSRSQRWQVGTVVLAIAVVGIAWTVTGRTLARLARGAAGGAIDVLPASELPLARAPVAPPSGTCTAWREDGVWTAAPRFPGGTDCQSAPQWVVVARAQAPAHEMVRHAWSDSAIALEVLVRIHRRARDNGPLRFDDRRSMPVDWVPDTLPSEFDARGGMRAQLDLWLDGILDGTPAWRGPTENVWIVDTPRGGMILLSGLGVTVTEPDERRRALADLLAPLTRPRLVQVVADGWSMQDVVDQCLEVQALVPDDVPCTWVAR
ncbi:MAG: hypothetical protein ACI8PZ_003314 [Myxococcota bacterium]|jgi:hypothetical protein